MNTLRIILGTLDVLLAILVFIAYRAETKKVVKGFGIAMMILAICNAILMFWR